MTISVTSQLAHKCNGISASDTKCASNNGHYVNRHKLSLARSRSAQSAQKLQATQSTASKGLRLYTGDSRDRKGSQSQTGPGGLDRLPPVELSLATFHSGYLLNLISFRGIQELRWNHESSNAFGAVNLGQRGRNALYGVGGAGRRTGIWSALPRRSCGSLGKRSR